MRHLTTIILGIAFLAVSTIAHGQPVGRHGMMDQDIYRGGPYGNYCPGMKWGPYGVRKPVKTAAEAKQAIETYLEGNPVGAHVGRIEESDMYYEAEILDRNDRLIDKQIVNKRTGRIRSIY